jgi:hypothetical protein
MMDLSGRYDVNARAYVVMQDAVQRNDRYALGAFLRIMRQRDETVQRGTLLITEDAFGAAGPDDAARSAAIGRAIVSWLAEHRAEVFQIRASVSQVDGEPAVTILDEADIQGDAYKSLGGGQ